MDTVDMNLEIASARKRLVAMLACKIFRGKSLHSEMYVADVLLQVVLVGRAKFTQVTFVTLWIRSFFVLLEQMFGQLNFIARLELVTKVTLELGLQILVDIPDVRLQVRLDHASVTAVRTRKRAIIQMESFDVLL